MGTGAPTDNRRRVPIRRLASFAALPAVAALTPLLAIPAITSSLGSAGWAAIAVGQAVGTLAMMIISYGWGTTGPSEIPKRSPAERADLYRTSFASRLLVAIPAVPLAACAAAWLATAEFRAASVITSVGFAIWGLSPTWYFVGAGRPIMIAAYETLPKLAAATISAVWLLLTPSSTAYGACFLVAGLASAVTAAARIGGVARWRVRGIREHLITNASITGARILGASFTTLSVPMVSIVQPGAVPVFAAVERFRNFAWMAVNAVAMALQGWAAEEPDAETSRGRRRTALAVTLSAGCLAGVSVAIGLPVLDSWVFSGQVVIPWDVAATTGATIAIVSASLSLTFHFLGPMGAGRPILLANVAGAIVGTPALLVFSTYGGALGAACAVLLAEAVVMAFLAWGKRRVESNFGVRA